MFCSVDLKIVPVPCTVCQDTGFCLRLFRQISDLVLSFTTTSAAFQETRVALTSFLHPISMIPLKAMTCIDLIAAADSLTNLTAAGKPAFTNRQLARLPISRLWYLSRA